MKSLNLSPMLLATLVTVAAGAGVAQGQSDPADSLRVPTAVDSPTGQIRCRAVISAGEGATAVSTGLEFVYPQLRSAAYLNVEFTSTDFATETDSQKAWFSTPGDDSHWTVPVTLGVAPVVITLVAAPRGVVNDRFVASFCGSDAVPVTCIPL
ncbi:MAG: hypothetical protein AAFW95_04130 [Cyanobacteria bacterium J06638_6]